MLRANLLPGRKKEKKFQLGAQDRFLIGTLIVFLIVLSGIYYYTVFEKKTASNNLASIEKEITTYSKEKVIYEDNKTLAKITYDLEKYLSTAVSSQFNSNVIFDNISANMLKSTTLNKITIDISKYYLVMDFTSASFNDLTKLFNNLSIDKKLKDIKILTYSVPLKSTAQSLNQSLIENQATIEIAATWVIE